MASGFSFFAQGKLENTTRPVCASQFSHIRKRNAATLQYPLAQFELLLKQLVGSQDSIQASKDWVVSRLGYYAVAIAWRLRAFCKETEVAAGGEGPKALPRSKVRHKAMTLSTSSVVDSQFEWLIVGLWMGRYDLCIDCLVGLLVDSVVK